MIRFIATDLDGTLLDEGRQLPQEIFPLIRALSSRGILFAPASGRQYANLEKLFFPVRDEVLFLCENGALVRYRGETLRLAPIANEHVADALAAIRSVKGLHPLLCGADSAYIDEKAEPFRTVCFTAYTHCRAVGTLEEVIGKEPVCKLAIYDEEPAAEHCMRLLPAKLRGLKLTVSGEEWCDVTAPDADKGEAVKAIMARFHFAREECVAFGDHMNDFEMLTACGRAYVPENAYPPLKKLIKNTVPSNAEGGVLKKIKEILSECEQ